VNKIIKYYNAHCVLIAKQLQFVWSRSCSMVPLGPDPPIAGDPYPIVEDLTSVERLAGTSV